MRLRISRESRLLVLTIVVSVVALLLLARFRFPEPSPAATVIATPLNRLAARAAYDDLAAAIGQLEENITPSLVVLEVEARASGGPVRLSDLLTTDARRDQAGYVPALRIDTRTAVASFDAGMQLDGIAGRERESRVASVLGINLLRHLARIGVPDSPVRELASKPLAELQTPSYVVAVEGTYAGITARPVFIGHAERFSSPRWTRPLLPLGGVPVTPGALMFALDGDFLGMAIIEHGALAIASASDLLDTARGLQQHPDTVPATAGLSLQPLTPSLAAATGARRGLVVADVEPDGPSDGALVAGDVITSVDDQPVVSPETVLLSLAARRAGDMVRLDVIRTGQPQQVQIALGPMRQQTSSAGPGAAPLDGVGLSTVRDLGCRVMSVAPGSVFDRLGVSAGDVITRAADVDRPSERDVRRVFTAAPVNTSVLLAVRQGARQRVVAVPIGAPPAQ